MKRGAQSGRPASQQPSSGAHVADQAPQFGLADSPYLRIDEAARFLRFDDCDNPEECCRKYLHRQAIPITRRGRVLLVERRVLELTLKRGA